MHLVKAGRNNSIRYSRNQSKWFGYVTHSLYLKILHLLEVIKGKGWHSNAKVKARLIRDTRNTCNLPITCTHTHKSVTKHSSTAPGRQGRGRQQEQERSEPSRCIQPWSNPKSHRNSQTPCQASGGLAAKFTAPCEPGMIKSSAGDLLDGQSAHSTHLRGSRARASAAHSSLFNNLFKGKNHS